MRFGRLGRSGFEAAGGVTPADDEEDADVARVTTSDPSVRDGAVTSVFVPSLAPACTCRGAIVFSFTTHSVFCAAAVAGADAPAAYCARTAASG
jgi:hypothetical protein